MRVAVIGYGSIGKRHAANIRSLGHTCDTYDLDVSGTGAMFHVGLLESHRSRHNAYVIATPHDRHIWHVDAAIDKAIPFYVEKPLGSIGQRQAWQDIIKKPLPIHAVGYMLRFHHNAPMLQSSRPVHLTCMSDMKRWPGSEYAVRDWLLEYSHEIDLALWSGAGAVDNVWSGEGRHYQITFARGDSVSLIDGCEVDLREWRTSSTTVMPLVGNVVYRDSMREFLDRVSGVITESPRAAQLSDGLATLGVCAQCLGGGG